MDRRTGEANVVIGQLQREMERLKADLGFTQEQAQEQKKAFEEERLHWLDEKQKVSGTAAVWHPPVPERRDVW